MVEATAVNVNEILESSRLAHCTQCKVYRFIETDLLSLSQGCRFNQDNVIVAVCRLFEQEAFIVAYLVSIDLTCEPRPYESMAAQHHNDRIQPHRLYQRGHEQREVEARSQLFAEHSVGHPDALAAGFKAGRWVCVDYILVFQGLIECRNLHTRPVSVERLIAVERPVARPSLKVVGRQSRNLRQRRSVGYDISRQQFGQSVAAGPLVVRQEAQREGLSVENFAVLCHFGG